MTTTFAPGDYSFEFIFEKGCSKVFFKGKGGLKFKIKFPENIRRMSGRDPLYVTFISVAEWPWGSCIFSEDEENYILKLPNRSSVWYIRKD